MLRAGLLLLGIDIGGTKIEFSLGDETGKIHRRLRRSTQPSGRAETDLRRIAEEARHLIGAAGARPEEIAALSQIGRNRGKRTGCATGGRLVGAALFSAPSPCLDHRGIPTFPESEQARQSPGPCRATRDGSFTGSP